MGLASRSVPISVFPCASAAPWTSHHGAYSDHLRQCPCAGRLFLVGSWLHNADLRIPADSEVVGGIADDQERGRGTQTPTRAWRAGMHGNAAVVPVAGQEPSLSA